MTSDMIAFVGLFGVVPKSNTKTIYVRRKVHLHAWICEGKSIGQTPYSQRE